MAAGRPAEGAVDGLPKVTIERAEFISRARAQVNRFVVALGVLGCLPLVLLAERLRPGGGRVMARRAIDVVAPLCGLTFDTLGAERLDPEGSYVFVPNHTSPLDIPAMVAARPDVRFVAAAELFRNPVLALLMKAMGTVPINRQQAREARRQIQELSASKERLSLTVFAEGRIASPEEGLPFKSGAFVVAIATGASVVPVAIRGGHLLPPGRALAVLPGTVTVEFLEPISTVGLVARDRKALRDRARAAVAAALPAPAEQRET